MTATDELRRMLDERGVKWWQSANTLGCIFTRWYSPLFGDEVCAMENGDEGLVLFDHYLTPAQAIVATVGRGTCHLEEIEKDCDTASEYMLGREWCFDAVYRCSCGCRFGHVAHNRPRFCPNCGARVVDE